MKHEPAKLLPATHDLQLGWAGAKAQLLAGALEGLGQKPTVGLNDFAETLSSNETISTLVPRRTWAVINATASLNVREAVAAAASDRLACRVIETCLYATGRLSLLLVEGPERNPNIGDLISEFYTSLSADAHQASLFLASGGLYRTEVGQGCGSLTMVISDGRISLFAAGMAEAIGQFQHHALPANGRVMVGTLTEDCLSVLWRPQDVEPCIVVTPDHEISWRVRISKRAHEKIVADVAQWSGVETGGILVGRISEAAQTVYVTDILPAPNDSHRSATEFILGARGVRAKLNEFSDASGYNLYCVGTWHNHLGLSDPSQTDRAAAKAIALARLTPSVLLISAPTSYRALLAKQTHPMPE